MLCRRRRKLPRRRVEALWPSLSPLFELSLCVFAGVAVSSVVAVTPLPPRRQFLVAECYIEMGWKAAEKLIRHWKIVRGDNVMIIRGKDKGESGVIKRVIRSQNRVIVEGKNLVKKHIKAGPGHEGGIFTVEAPLHASNVQVVDPVTGKPCKVGIKYLEDGTKVRVSRGIGTSGSIIPRPEILKIRTTPRPTQPGPKDTPMEHVLEKTYDAKTGMGMPDL
ncbi:uncharacterized protein LOC107625018 isoform X1 [Arachis ipaensis]|nr:uncharacterized protein LOC107625018 isoform X1 [Arachis ipaensis]XP_025632487.1 uncharacterized protein LOC112727084 isoform X1 [Arachis hypogaea]